jgi:hypothetical protein
MASKWDTATAKTRQVQRAVMSRVEFMALVLGWSGGLVLLLFISAMTRYLARYLS